MDYTPVAAIVISIHFLHAEEDSITLGGRGDKIISIHFLHAEEDDRS